VPTGTAMRSPGTGGTIASGSAATTGGAAGADSSIAAAGGASAGGSGGATGAAGIMSMSFPGGHLFDVCVGTSGCLDALECFCGFCSRQCPADGCGGLATGASCSAGFPSSATCLEAPGSECVTRCFSDSDCGVLGPTAVCTVGWCRRPLLVSVSDGHVLTCADRAAAMKARLDPVVAKADRSCLTDANCVLAPLGNSCYGSGCDAVPVSAVGADAIAAELATLNQDCDAVFRAGCVGAGRQNCGLLVAPTCVAGTCQERLP
jgi:hypothetical protein